jgi:hypothetical protein
VNTLELALRRDEVIVAVALGLLTLLAWFYIWEGAGMGMTALQMTKVA